MSKFDRPASPPPPLFFGQKERDLAKQVSDEMLERFVGQYIAYYAISQEHTTYHPVYGEAIDKTFYPPVRVYALIEWEGTTQIASESYGLDLDSRIVIFFSKRRINDDQDLMVNAGDFVAYGDRFYEIVKLEVPKEMYGQYENRFEIKALAVRSRRGSFDAT